MQLHQLEYFIAVAEDKNFSKAAERLHISQPALSLQIKKLEEQLNCQLLDRTGKGVIATEAGKALLKYCRQIMSQLDEARFAVEQSQGLNRGSLAIGVVQSVNACLMPELISRFLSKYPGIKLQIHELPATIIEKQLEEGLLSLGISFTPPQLKGLDSETLFSEELIAICAKLPQGKSKHSIPFSMLKDEPIVTFPNGFQTRQIVDELFGRIHSEPQIILETNTIQSILMAVRRTNAITVLPNLAMRLHEAKGLHTLKISGTNLAKRSIGIHWPKDISLKKAAEAFVVELRHFIHKESL